MEVMNRSHGGVVGDLDPSLALPFPRGHSLSGEVRIVIRPDCFLSYHRDTTRFLILRTVMVWSSS